MDISFLKKIKIERKIKKENSDVQTDLYWKFIVIFSFVCVCVAFGFGIYFFQNLNNTTQNANEKNVQNNDLINKNKLDSVIKYFTEKEQKSKDIIVKPAPVIDPSL